MGNMSFGQVGAGTRRRAATLALVAVTVASMIGAVIAPSSVAHAAAGDISTFAGLTGSGSGVPTGVALASPTGAAVDSAGNVYIVDVDRHRVWKATTTGTIVVVAGNGASGFSGDGGPATSAQLSFPRGVAVDGTGNVFIADTGNNRVRKVTPAGVISTFAGTGVFGSDGDGGPAPSAQLAAPSGVAVDISGNVYIADRDNHRIRRVNSSGVISGFAGTGVFGYLGDGGLATNARLNSPSGVAVDAAGSVYIADRDNHRVRKVTAGLISTIAGNGASGFLGDGGPATTARLHTPSGVAVDALGNVYIADTTNHRVRKVSSGNISTLAGIGVGGFSGDGGLAVNAVLDSPLGIAADPAGNVFIADTFNVRVRKVGTDLKIATFAGNGTFGFSGDGGAATSAQLLLPHGVAVDVAGNVYIADEFNNRIRKVTPAGVISTFAGTGVAGFSGDGGAATSAQLDAPTGVVADADGNVYIADSQNHRIRKVTSAGVISTYAGTGVSGFSGDGGPATNATFRFPRGVALDRAGNVFIADTGNSRVRKVVPSGLISTFAGNGFIGFVGDGGLATAAQLNNPHSVSVDSAGNVFIADTDNSAIRKVSTASVITTVAGNGMAGFSGDGGAAESAQLSFPRGVVVDGAGSLFIADTGNSRVRKVTAGGVISTVAGGSTTGLAGDGGPATSAQLDQPAGVALDGRGNLLVSDTGNDRVRSIETLGVPTIRGFTSVTPVRLFDTRLGEPDGAVPVAKAPVGGAYVLKVKVTGVGGVPAFGVGAVALNVTAVGPAAEGFVTVYPCGTRPLASNLNFTAGQTVPNAVIAPVSAAGEVCFFSNVNTNLLADVSGWFAASAGFTSVTPVRVFDTRPGEPDGAVVVPKAQVGGSNVLRVRVTGVGGVPATGVGAVALNVTAVGPVAEGFVTVFPCGTRPLASNLNFTAGQTVPNAVIAPVSASGEVCFYGNVNTHLLADVSGWFAASAGFSSVTPVRVFDTRLGEPDGVVPVAKAPVGGAYVLRVKATGVGGVPATGVGAVALNVTAVGPQAEGFVTVYPCGTRPLASNLNFTAGKTVPNSVIAPVSAAGEVCLYSNVNTNLLADVSGWFDASS